MDKKIYTPEFLEHFSKPANNLTLLEHAAIQIYSAMIANNEYKTDSMATPETVVAHTAIYKAQILLREMFAENKRPFIADRYGFESAVDPYLITDGSKGGKSS